MFYNDLRKFIGLSGVSSHENALAKRWARHFESVMALIAVWLPVQWYMERKLEMSKATALGFSWIIWVIFLAEAVTIIYLVNNRKRFLVHNWMYVLILILSFPPIWTSTPLIAVLRSMRLLLLIRLAIPFWNRMKSLLSKNRFSSTLVVAVIMTTFWGVIIAAVEPNVKTAWDGIWFAWETITTIGYGDVVPTTFSGRLLAIVLMISGVGLISLLTANFSAYIIGKSTRVLKSEEDEIIITLKSIQRQLKEIQKRMQKLESGND